jgi:hypothetical protein
MHPLGMKSLFKEIHENDEDRKVVKINSTGHRYYNVCRAYISDDTMFYILGSNLPSMRRFRDLRYNGAGYVVIPSCIVLRERHAEVRLTASLPYSDRERLIRHVYGIFDDLIRRYRIVRAICVQGNVPNFKRSQ